MSRAAKTTLIAAIVLSTFTIWGVHYLQKQERETMYKGVLRDDARRREKIELRTKELQESLRKRKLYESVQHVDDNEGG